MTCRRGLHQGSESANKLFAPQPSPGASREYNIVYAQWHGRFARIDSRESFAFETPVFIARQADSHE